MTDFNQFGLPARLTESLTHLGFNAPTPIQKQAIPLALDGRDILGTAQTGTGKTGAFGIPLVSKLMNDPYAGALVMTPTRELAVQVMHQLKGFMGPNSGIRTALLIGGEPMPKQFAQLNNKPRLIVGTPGRINDHLERGTVNLSKAGFLVLDEADRMLDMGFGIQLELIAEYLPQERQTLLFSATLPPNIIKLSRKYLNNPERVEVGATNTAAPKIKQELIQTTDEEKYEELTRLLDSRSGHIIVFVKTKHGADKLARRLAREKHSADAIHGDLRQNQRDRVIRAFRNKECRILVATDVAARGLDIPHLETVINYDLPQVPEDYIHRIGRTGRNGAEGEAICLISPADRSKWTMINRLLNPSERPAKGERSDEGGRKANGRFRTGRRGPSSEPKFGKFGFKEKKPFAHSGEGEFRRKPFERNSDNRFEKRGDRSESFQPHSRNKSAEGNWDPVERAPSQNDNKRSDAPHRKSWTKGPAVNRSGSKDGASKKFGQKFDQKPFGQKRSDGQFQDGQSQNKGSFKKGPAKGKPFGKSFGKPSGKAPAGKSYGKPSEKSFGKSARPGAHKPRHDAA